MRLTARFERNPGTHLVEDVRIEIHVPPEFPEKYTNAVVKAAEVCTVKRHLEHPPRIETVVVR